MVLGCFTFRLFLVWFKAIFFSLAFFQNTKPLDAMGVALVCYTVVIKIVKKVSLKQHVEYISDDIKQYIVMNIEKLLLFIW